MQQSVLPADLERSQDQLLLAGSKMSYRDIYDLEISIPSVRGKYYHADKVDDVFIILNGVLTDISEEAFRKQHIIDQMRGEVESLKAQVTELTANDESEKLKREIADMDKDLDKLETVIADLEFAYTTLKDERNKIKDDYDTHVLENESLRNQIAQLQSTLSQRESDLNEREEELAYYKELVVNNL